MSEDVEEFQEELDRLIYFFQEGDLSNQELKDEIMEETLELIDFESGRNE